jgi:hypothetical protein
MLSRTTASSFLLTTLLVWLTSWFHHQPTTEASSFGVTTFPGKVDPTKRNPLHNPKEELSNLQRHLNGMKNVFDDTEQNQKKGDKVLKLMKPSGNKVMINQDKNKNTLMTIFSPTTKTKTTLLHHSK